MKKSLWFILLLSVSFPALGQFGDADKEAENLYLMSRVWGFIKYFHPEVKDCQIEWDLTLMNSLSELNGADQSEFNSIVSNLMDEAGFIIPQAGSAPTYPQDDFLYNLEYDWMDSALFNEELKTKLQELKAEVRPQDHCLLEQVFTNGNLDFSGEKSYNVGTYPNINFRILGVFRYWNTIEYFFPYKHLMDQDWDETFLDFVLPIAYAQDAPNYHLNFKKFSTYINDTHAFMSSQEYFALLGGELNPFRVGYVEGETVILSVHPDIIDLEVGDIVRKIYGKDINTVRDSFRTFTAGSNDPVIERNINDVFLYGDGLSYEMEVEKADGTNSLINLVSDRDAYLEFLIGSEETEAYSTIEIDEGCSEFGYVNMGILEGEDIQNMVIDLWDKEAIIIDQRNYPNGTLWPLVPYLFNTSINIAKFTVPNEDFPGTFTWSNEYIGYNNNNQVYQGRLIILMNEVTQSQAEYTIMGLEQHPNAIKIGSQTSGADGNVSIINIPGDILLYFTGLGTYYPDETETQRIGIVPDIEVKPTIAGIRAGRDEVLEVAMNCDLISSIPFLEDELSYDVFPNPFGNTFHVNLNKGSIHPYQIFNNQGRLIQKGSLKNDDVINLTLAPSGLYFIQLESDGKFLTKKIIKQ